MNFKTNAGILATLLSTLAAAAPAFADTTLQSFICDQRGTVSFNQATSKDKHFAIGGTRVAALVDAQAQGPVGIVYEVDPPQNVQFSQYYYKEATGSNAHDGLSVRYCFQKSDGSSQRSVTIPASTTNRGGNVGDGWTSFITDSRLFPDYVQNGQGYLTRVAFIFKDKKGSGNNITIGRIDLSPGAINVGQIITTPGDCSLKDSCTKQVVE
ncbi:MAG TPA: hypothetical protein V6C76_02990 [Drouetiella sp.]